MVRLTRPLSVGVLVTLELSPRAGGHVKCWERFAEAATNLPDALDLTVYFLGKRETTTVLAENVRFRQLPAVLASDRFSILNQGAGNTDLAGYHKGLAHHLIHHDVLHGTDSFSFSRTARTLAVKQGKALVHSIHTDLPKFIRVYSREIIGRVVGQGALGSAVLDGVRIPEMLGRNAERKIKRLLRGADRILVSKDEDRDLVRDLVPPEHLSGLRRGIDKTRFNPANRDRRKLRETLGVPEDKPVLLFVGRADDSKNVMTMVKAARVLLDRGIPLHVLCLGDGARLKELRTLLGENGTAPGNRPQKELSGIYASADLFVFPSESEVTPNVVREARASGLPVFLSAKDGGAQFVVERGVDGMLLDSQDPTLWADALEPFLTDANRRKAMGAAARTIVEADDPSWLDVLELDLMPAWTGAALDKGLGTVHWGAHGNG
ncbi:MAG: glycosyltransferase [Rhodospirillum sp.]|nr:glycosyltransferase [Rhodospirillum sp.]MCF8488240.1 glycosyltransferase [Rhodospirillum sp.]MCF8502878.1 glycosyltransferase [Rhodospirillum sp.]